MKLVAHVFPLNGGFLSSSMFAEDGEGRVDAGMTNTLLQLVEEACPHCNEQIEDLLRGVEAGTYVPNDPEHPDFGYNAVQLWVLPRGDGPDGAIVAHDYIPEYSSDEGTPQRFNFAQLRFSMAHWTEFQRRLRADGREAWLGRLFEAELPA